MSDVDYGKEHHIAALMYNPLFSENIEYPENEFREQNILVDILGKIVNIHDLLIDHNITIEMNYHYMNSVKSIGIHASYKEIDKIRFTAKVDEILSDSVICIVDFQGYTVPFSFPRHIIEYHNLKIGDEFEWYPSKKRKMSTQDCKPIKNKFSRKELIYRIKRFIHSAKSQKNNE